MITRRWRTGSGRRCLGSREVWGWVGEGCWGDAMLGMVMLGVMLGVMVCVWMAIALLYSYSPWVIGRARLVYVEISMNLIHGAPEGPLE